MSKTLEEIALQVAKDMGDMSPWGVEEFASRLVAALGAHEPVAWVQKEMLHDDGFTHAFNVQPYATEGYIPLYAAPVVPAGWQMVPKEPTKEMVAASWEVAGSVRFADGTRSFIPVAYQAMLSAASEEPT